MDAVAITLRCPNLKCRMVLRVPSDVRGKKVRCSSCGTAFIVPMPSPRPEPAVMADQRSDAAKD